MKPVSTIENFDDPDGFFGRWFQRRQVGFLGWEVAFDPPKQRVWRSVQAFYGRRGITGIFRI
jgi:hypothetical protein